ncbi:MAG: hypothetical protein HUU50_13640 [Candidatus Brocadiae bacterium]|nr:hypothetical protein [Candidatus Brocadiia bacterium]
MKKTSKDILTIFIFFLLSIALRYYSTSFRLGCGEHVWIYPNRDTKIHVLFNIDIYQKYSIEEHKFLCYHGGGGPFIQIKIRDTVYDLYTSFNPPLFLIPYFLGVRDENDLKCFNLSLHFLSAVLIYFLISTLLGKKSISPILCTVLYIFNFNMLHYCYEAYWGHQLAQPFFLALLYLVARKGDEAKIFPCCILSFFACWIAWTGYLFTFGIFIFFIRFKKIKKAFAVAVSAIIAILLPILHFGLVITLPEYIQSLLNRANVRGGSGFFFFLLNDIFIEYSLLIFTLLATSFFLKNRKSILVSFRQKIAIFLIASVPLLELFFLANHDWYYGFGRIKIIIPFLLLASLFLDALYEEKPKTTVTITGIVIVANCLYYCIIF